MKHTPGPWDCEMRNPAGIKWDAIIRSKEKRDPICSVFMAGYMAKEADANARLIAAAPDMLMALKYVMDDEPNLLPRATSECRKVIAAVIEKATK